MPSGLQGLSEALPMTYAVWGLWELMLKGAGLGAVGFELGILVAFAVGFSTATAIAMRRVAWAGPTPPNTDACVPQASGTV
jgi:ABC-type multidrug transport system permease subunit